jgi:outer membrane protein assembly factor BamA
MTGSKGLFRLRAALAVLAGFCALAGAAIAAEKPVIRVLGEKAFGERRVADFIPLPDPLPEWDREEWASWAEDAALLVREGYREQGYFDAEDSVVPIFVDSLLKAQEYPPPRFIEVRVSEGVRYRFGSVRVDLPPAPFPRFDSTTLAARRGRVFNRNLLFQDRREVLRFYGDAGFLKAQAAESLFYDFDRKAVDVVFKVRPGPALVFDTLLLRIQREGDTTGLRGKTRPSVLRGLFPTEPGDTLSLRDINTFERKLRSTRAFNFVRLRDSGGSAADGRSAILLAAEEKVPGEMEIAGYWETQYGFGTDLSWAHNNFAGRLQETRLGLTLAQRKQSVLAGFSAPLLFGTSVRFDNDLVSNWYQDSRLQRRADAFDGDFDISNQSRLSRPITTWARAVSGAELFGKSERLDSVTRARDFNLNFLNSVYLQRLDNPISPARGARLALTWGNGGPLLDGTELAVFREGSRHNWLEAEAAGYLPVGRFAVVALRVDGGRFYGQGGINSSRFYLGGPRSVRSRDWRSVCPRVTVEDNCLEEGIEPAYVLGSAELRVSPFIRATSGFAGHLAGVQIVPFADYGNVWEVGQAVTPAGRGRAVGLGLRYGFLTLFNIRVDYAQDPEDSSRKRWILDLAQAF